MSSWNALRSSTSEKPLSLSLLRQKFCECIKGIPRNWHTCCQNATKFCRDTKVNFCKKWEDMRTRFKETKVPSSYRESLINTLIAMSCELIVRGFSMFSHPLYRSLGMIILLVAIPLAWVAHYNIDKWGHHTTFWREFKSTTCVCSPEYLVAIAVCFISMIPLQRLFDWCGEELATFVGEDLQTLIVVTLSKSVLQLLNIFANDGSNSSLQRYRGNVSDYFALQVRVSDRPCTQTESYANTRSDCVCSNPRSSVRRKQLLIDKASLILYGKGVVVLHCTRACLV